MRVWKVGVEEVSSNVTAPITKVLALNIRLCSSNEVLGLLGYRSCGILGKICRCSEISPCIRHITVNNTRAPLLIHTFGTQRSAAMATGRLET